MFCASPITPPGIGQGPLNLGLLSGFSDQERSPKNVFLSLVVSVCLCDAGRSDETSVPGEVAVRLQEQLH